MEEYLNKWCIYQILMDLWYLLIIVEIIKYRKINIDENIKSKLLDLNIWQNIKNKIKIIS